MFFYRDIIWPDLAEAPEVTDTCYSLCRVLIVLAHGHVTHRCYWRYRQIQSDPENTGSGIQCWCRLIHDTASFLYTSTVMGPWMSYLVEATIVWHIWPKNHKEFKKMPLACILSKHSQYGASHPSLLHSNKVCLICYHYIIEVLFVCFVSRPSKVDNILIHKRQIKPKYPQLNILSSIGDITSSIKDI